MTREELVHALCFWYRVVLASAPLLELAIRRSRGDLQSYYRQHLAEETGHEAMIRDDLAGLGVLQIPNSHTAAQLAGSQYYLIAHDDPALLLGYMRVLESGPRVSVDDLEARFGVPMTALRHHAQHDPWHLADIDRMIMSLDEPSRARVAWNEAGVRTALLTCGGY